MATKSPTKLTDLLADLDIPSSSSWKEVKVTGVTADSRQVKPGNLFVAVAGQTVDGHLFIADAIARGCSAVIIEDRGIKKPEKKGVIQITVPDSRTALGKIAAAFYGNPAEKLCLIGITGTNGKTTTSYLIEKIIAAAGGKPGVIGTINYRYIDNAGRRISMDAPLTTPEAPLLQKTLREMVDAGVTHVIMEASSHALALGRLAAIQFDIAVFTNLSRDHLDFHRDMADYFASKKKLFTAHLRPQGRAVIMNDDTVRDSWGKKLAQSLDEHQVISCGLRSENTIKARSSSFDLKRGIRAELETPANIFTVRSALVGDFNLKNILVATGISYALGIDNTAVKKGLARPEIVPGRLELVRPEAGRIRAAVLVDFAHTPDALENVLTTLNRLKKGRVICVFGCGGDRDPGKREMMGGVAGNLADVVIATSDNPRSENPKQILAAISKGVETTGMKRIDAGFLGRDTLNKYAVISGRRDAIRRAIAMAAKNDVVLISGKGHEDYQLINKTKKFFSDRIEAKKQLTTCGKKDSPWTLREICKAAGGELYFQDRMHTAHFRAISTDTRTIIPGDIFIGLNGPNFKGADFAEQAVQKGAAALILDRLPADPPTASSSWSEVPVLIVDDTLKALGDLARFHRLRLKHLRVLAITGSSGKTTVKEMTANILSQKWKTLKTEGNLNNLVGLPLTIFRATTRHSAAVLEAGTNQPGELTRLAEIASPDISCITNIQEAHLEGLGSISGVAKAKGELFAGTAKTGILVVNDDDPRVRKLAGQHSADAITFAATPAGRRLKPMVRATHIKNLGESGTRFTLHVDKYHQRLTINSPGRHNVSNGLAAAALAHAAGLDFTDIIAGLTAYTPFDKRAQITTLVGGIKAINDTYNANPSSMRAALRTLIDVRQSGRAMVILGDMLELGDAGLQAHETLGREAAEMGVDFIGAFGEFSKSLVSAAHKKGLTGKTAKSFTDKKKMADWVRELIRSEILGPGDWILFKGSRGMRMETVLEKLQGGKD